MSTFTRFSSAAVLAASLLAAHPGAAATYHWAAAGPTQWNAVFAWQPWRDAPATDDTLVFDQPGASQAIDVPSQTVGRLVVGNGCQLILHAVQPGGATLTLLDLPGLDFSITAGSSMTMDTTGAISIALPTGATGRIEGSLAFRRAGHRLLTVDAGSIAFAAGSQMEAGMQFSGNPFGTSGNLGVRFEAGSLYRHIAGGNPFGAAAPQSAVVFEPGSRFRLDADVQPSFAGRTYADFEFNAPGTVSSFGSQTFQVDSVIVSQGTWNVQLTGSTRIRGNVRLAGGDLNFAPSSASVVSFVGTYRQQLWLLRAPHSVGAAPGVTFEVDNPEGVQLRTPINLPRVRFTRGIVHTFAPGEAVNTIQADVREGASAASGWVSGALSVPSTIAAPSCSVEVGDSDRFLPMMATYHGLGANQYTVGMVRSGTPDISFEGSGLDTTRLLGRWWLFWPGLFASPAATCDVVLSYVPADLPAGATPGSLVAAGRGASWYPLTIGAVTDTTIEILGITASQNGIIVFGLPAGTAAADPGRMLELALRFPNPSPGPTRFDFTLPSPGPVRLTVFDVQGRAIATVADEPMEAGRHTRSWGGAGAPHGVYFARLEGCGRQIVRRLVLMP